MATRTRSTANLVDPTESASGSFGGDVVALKLNIDFSDAGLTTGSSGLRFGDLRLCNVTGLSGLNGSTVCQFLGVVNTALGAGSTPYSVADLDSLTSQVNASFAAGASVFAQQHIVNGSCPP